MNPICYLPIFCPCEKKWPSYGEIAEQVASYSSYFSVLQVDVIAGMQPGQAAKVAAFMGFEGDQLTQVKPSLN